MVEILLIALIIALFCSGLGILTEYNPDAPKRHQMILYWLKKPFVEHEYRVDQFRGELINKIGFDYADKINAELSKCNPDEIIIDLYRKTKDQEIELANSNKEKKLNYQFYLKPIILCVYCFPSFWGSIIFFTLNYLFNFFPVDLKLIPVWLITIIIALPINAIIYGTYEKLTK